MLTNAQIARTWIVGFVFALASVFALNNTAQARGYHHRHYRPHHRHHHYRHLHRPRHYVVASQNGPIVEFFTRTNNALYYGAKTLHRQLGNTFGYGESNGAPSNVHAMVTAAAARHGVPANVAHAIVKKESNYRCGVQGAPTKYGRAIGIMQTIPSTARAMIGHLPHNCVEELEAGMKYLGQIVAQHGTGCAALARYEGNHFCSPYGRDAARLASRGR